MAEKLITDVFSTRAHPAARRGDAWEAAVRGINFGLRFSHDRSRPYRGHFRRHAAGGFQLVQFVEDPACFERDREHVRTDGCDGYQLIQPLAGACEVEHLDRGLLCRPGGFFLLDIGEPMRIAQRGPMQALIFTLPRARMEAGLRDPHRLCGRALDGRRGLVRASLDLLRALSREGAGLAPRQFRLACGQFLDLWLLGLEGADLASIGDGRIRAMQWRCVREHVQRHLSDAALATPGIAAALGLSVRSVQMLFAAFDTTPRDYIREQRLVAARRLLESPGHRTLTVTQIAYDCGFGGSAHFSTLFRLRFGESPNRWRQQAFEAPPLRRDLEAGR